MGRLRFGIFLAPFHPAGENPTLALERDLELVVHLDRLGYDEAWIGEHHSAGSEIIASPEIFIATAAERTRHIRLGTGVTSLTYHNPLWVAERMVLLDHLTRGRTMLGIGPGSLPTDSAMIGLNPTDTRDLLDINVDIVMRLLRSDEPITIETATHKLYDARLHLRPYTQPHFDVAIAAVASPTGPRLAGRYGVGLLSVGATLRGGLRRAGPSLGRDGGARSDVRHDRRPRQVEARRARPRGRDARAGLQGRRVRDRAVVPLLPGGRGLPADGRRGRQRARDDRLRQHRGRRRDRHVGGRRGQIEKLQRQSNGGFGAYLMLAHEWANPAATHRSYELIAQHVMPVFQGQAQSTLDAKARAQSTRDEMAQTQNDAVAHMTEKYEREVAATRS